jgi:muramoyltetrapeptide carboxypeptidase LdcA involved in peptidoglycan recycling
VVVDLPFGHGAANLAFPIGATVEIDTNALQIIWK